MPTRLQLSRAAKATDTPTLHRGEPLPPNLLRFYESRLNADLSRVRIHISPLATRLRAAAFTCGENIVFRPGTWAPESTSGMWLLAHELTHVLQQRAGLRIPVARGGPLLDDPILEAEADAVADAITRGLVLHRITRRIANPRFPERQRHAVAPVVQRQKWGWLGQHVLQENGATVGPFDSYETLDRSQLGQLRDLDDNSKPTEAKVIRYNSTATLNEAYATRAEAWERAVELAEEVAKISVLWPTLVYYVGQSSTESTIPSSDMRLLADGLASDPPGHAHNRVWVNYKSGNNPDPAGMGIYYEYRQDTRGGGLLLVEHMHDSQAIVYSRRNNGAVPETTVNPAKHFHVAFYRRVVGSRYAYLPIDAYFPGKEYGAYTFAKTEQLESRSSYDIKYLPSHHIYYLAD